MYITESCAKKHAQKKETKLHSKNLVVKCSKIVLFSKTIKDI